MQRHNGGDFTGERAGAHFLSIYQTVMAQLPPVGESTDVPTSFGSVRAYWIAGGADVDDSLPEATLISAGTTDYVLRKALPKSFTFPALALIAGRSVMLDAARAARARNLLPRAQVELWADASHGRSTANTRPRSPRVPAGPEMMDGA